MRARARQPRTGILMATLVAKSCEEKLAMALMFSTTLVAPCSSMEGMMRKGRFTFSVIL